MKIATVKQGTQKRSKGNGAGLECVTLAGFKWYLDLV